MFAKATINLGDTPLVITAKNQSPDNVYVQALTWNGKKVAGTEIVRFAPFRTAASQQILCILRPRGEHPTWHCGLRCLFSPDFYYYLGITNILLIRILSTHYNVADHDPVKNKCVATLPFVILMRRRPGCRVTLR